MSLLDCGCKKLKAEDRVAVTFPWESGSLETANVPWKVLGKCGERKTTKWGWLSLEQSKIEPEGLQEG